MSGKRGFKYLSPSIPSDEGVTNIVKKWKPPENARSIDDILDSHGSKKVFISFSRNKNWDSNKGIVSNCIDILSITSEYCFYDEYTHRHFYLIREPYGYALWIHSKGTDFEKIPLRQNDLTGLFDDFTSLPQQPRPSTSHA